MKKSSRVGIVLAISVTTSSSFLVWDDDTGNSWPLGLQVAQASTGSSSNGLETPGDRTMVLTQSALLERQRHALVSRVRGQLLSRAPAAVSESE